MNSQSHGVDAGKINGLGALIAEECKGDGQSPFDMASHFLGDVRDRHPVGHPHRNSSSSDLALDVVADFDWTDKPVLDQAIRMLRDQSNLEQAGTKCDTDAADKQVHRIMLF